MSLNTLFAILTTVLSFVAAVFVLDQYVHRPRPYKLVWSIGLLAYAVGALTEVIAPISGWSLSLYEVWYFAGALVTAAYLGMGTFYLLAPRRWADGVMIVLGLTTLYAAIRVFTVSLNEQSIVAKLNSTQIANLAQVQVMPLDIEILAPILNILGAAFLFGGALYSAWVFLRRHEKSYRVVSNVLIACGSIFPSFMTGLVRLGYTYTFFLGQFLGIAFILAGFLVSIEVFQEFRLPFTNIVFKQRPALVEHRA